LLIRLHLENIGARTCNVNDNTSWDVAQECTMMAGSYTRTACNKNNLGTVPNSYSCKI